MFSRRFLMLAILLCATSLLSAAEGKRPNIVVILADDMGYSDIGCFGSEIATPNLDKLAAGGVRITQFYNTGRCCPSRASLLTGLYSHQAGVGHMVEDHGAPGYRGFLNDKCVTVAEVLKSAGYHTMMCGKWHVGEARPHWPVDRGFERYYGIVNGGSNYFRLDPNRTLVLDSTPVKPEGDNFYFTDAYTDNALKFLDETRGKDQPFFLYLAYTAPHWPLHARPEDIAKYKGKYLVGWDAIREARNKKQVELGILDAKWALSPRHPDKAWASLNDKEKQDFDQRMAVYAAQIDRMDQGIGRVLSKLKELNADENTLVMFLSDNGGCAEVIDRGKADAEIGTADSFTSYRPSWANASNTPMRLYKHYVHEGGISTPFIAYWPARFKKSEIYHSVGHITDLMPTCLDAAGVEYPKTFAGREVTPVAGKSLLPLLDGKTKQIHDAVFFEHEGNRAVRQGQWKLVAEHNKPWELYDMEADRSELHDLAAKNKDKVEELVALYKSWAERSNVLPWGEVNKKKAKGEGKGGD